jgi:hypothetical protein
MLKIKVRKNIQQENGMPTSKRVDMWVDLVTEASPAEFAWWTIDKLEPENKDSRWVKDPLTDTEERHSIQRWLKWGEIALLAVNKDKRVQILRQLCKHSIITKREYLDATKDYKTAKSGEQGEGSSGDTSLEERNELRPM